MISEEEAKLLDENTRLGETLQGIYSVLYSKEDWDGSYKSRKEFQISLWLDEISDLVDFSTEG